MRMVPAVKAEFAPSCSLFFPDDPQAFSGKELRFWWDFAYFGRLFYAFDALHSTNHTSVDFDMLIRCY